MKNLKYKLIKILCNLIPSSKLRKSIRKKYLQKELVQNKHYSNNYHNSFIHPTTEIYGIQNFSIGENCWIGGHCGITASDAGVKLGNNVIIAWHCHFISRSHNYTATNILPYDRGNICRPIEIEDCVWVGFNSIILGGVKIEKGAIVGAGSVVTKSVPKCAIVAGNPAKIVGWRDEKIFDKLYSEGKFEELEKVDFAKDYEIIENRFNEFLEDTRYSKTLVVVEREREREREKLP